MHCTTKVNIGLKKEISKNSVEMKWWEYNSKSILFILNKVKYHLRITLIDSIRQYFSIIFVLNEKYFIGN